MTMPESMSVHVSPSQALLSSSDEPLGELLTVQEAAQFLKVTVSWVYEHVRPDADDRLPVLKFGKYLRFDARDLRSYIDEKRESARHPRRRR
jgi:excisionase family DNA binding protein